MKKHRISTIISEKHWELLKKYTEKYETQRRALEFALENLENVKGQEKKLSPVEQLWMRIGRDMGSSICLLHRSQFEELIDTANYDRMSELFINLKAAEYLVVWYYQKPLKRLSLKEVIEGIINISRPTNWFNTINYKDNGNFYGLEVNHILKMKGSRLFNIFFEDLFEAYGVKTESKISETGFFIKIYKGIK